MKRNIILSLKKNKIFQKKKNNEVILFFSSCFFNKKHLNYKYYIIILNYICLFYITKYKKLKNNMVN
ncbi:hypothetical protein PFBG_04270 [Plasmodium falciparum 7G8]|uniref:Uncharacterized protein n=3 Tax=Plasmodium falciparum TaxID=5833 RepID=A0A024V458_PLAFA|nr:hypothetical protein PFFVO_03841 [Plasmodium falciparum Vietnam Oak-Knoll (FVO)]ETW41158.1 hypothetical protein PFNF135_04399 [Plasmodium falciparum NF135/5.C10]EUR66690.1 hypothetical protein PFBG_04270 [Plasmodium falciparum 7G8]